jgi:colanic acid biosynthesis protein WcaH
MLGVTNTSYDRLTDSELLEVVERTPLVSIDLVVRDDRSRILLGPRRNEPAKETWFVPGGRIVKDEDLDQAFARITEAELGMPRMRSTARLLGTFSHRYNRNFLNREGVATHYVVLAYELHALRGLTGLPAKQHTDYRWWSAVEAAESDSVNRNNLPYFILTEQPEKPTGPAVLIAQYEALNNRRNSFNQLLWQAPALSLTAQAFLFSIIFSKDVNWESQLPTSALACFTALASLHLLVKHRVGEVDAAKRLQRLERDNGFDPVNGPGYVDQDPLNSPWYIQQSAYRLWFILLSLFGATSLWVVAKNIFSLYQ